MENSDDKGMEIEIDDISDTIEKRTGNLNKREIDLANQNFNEIQRAYLGTNWKTINDYFCDDCKKTLLNLVNQWKRKQLDRQDKGLPMLKRKLSYFVVNEKLGRGLDAWKKLPNGKLLRIPFGNVNRLCRSCNGTKLTHKINQPLNENTLESVKISHSMRGGYIDKLSKILLKERHVCKVASFNKISASLSSTQKTMERTLAQYIDIKYDLIEIDEYHIVCKYRFCDGEHIIKLGKPPELVLDDLQTEEKEIKEEQDKLDDLI